MRTFLRAIFAILILCAARDVVAGTATEDCFVNDVLDLIASGRSDREITSQCGRRVLDSKCSVSKIRKLRDTGIEDSDIVDQCETLDRSVYDRNLPRSQARTARACATPMGPCPLAPSVAIPLGSPCWCPSIYGPLWGVAQ
jgi:hypothetical protein